MFDFHSTLLREKFIIHDTSVDMDEDKAIVALSNRIVIPLPGAGKAENEVFIVRAQNMHSCIRMAARILNTYIAAGPIMNRPHSFDWESAWEAIVNDYEYRYNPDRWIAVYHNGHTIFKSGEYHLLLDVIEKCDARNSHNYERSLPLAEEAFKAAGKIVKIKHESNVALVVNLQPDQGRFGVIMRGAARTTTFNFSVVPQQKGALNYAQCLAVAACFLEGVQLAFMVGMNNIKLVLGIFKRHSMEEKKTKEAGRRLGRLNAEIDTLERACVVRYRPEKPEFSRILSEAEQLGQKILHAPGSEDNSGSASADEPRQGADDKDGASTGHHGA